MDSLDGKSGALIFPTIPEFVPEENAFNMSQEPCYATALKSAYV